MTRDSRTARHAASSYAQQAQDALEAGQDVIEDQAKAAWSMGSRWAGDAMKAGKRAASSIDESFKERPIAMHMLAIAVGFVLAALLFRRR